MKLRGLHYQRVTIQCLFRYERHALLVVLIKSHQSFEPVNYQLAVVGELVSLTYL
jgi:hypothetical protein